MGEPIGLADRSLIMTATTWTEEKITRLADLWRKGWTAAAIAEDLGIGVSRCAVLGKIRRLGLHRGPRPKTAAAPTARPRCASRRPVASSRASKPDGPPAPPPTALASVLGIGRGECRWPYGDPGDVDFGLCGRPVERGAYCAAHAAVGYQRPVDTLEGWARFPVFE